MHMGIRELLTWLLWLDCNVCGVFGGGLGRVFAGEDDEVPPREHPDVNPYADLCELHQASCES